MPAAPGSTVALPQGWSSIPQMVPPKDMQVGDPVTRIVVASAPISFGKGCNVATYAFPSTAVALVVVEWVRLSKTARWPRPPSPLHRHDLARPGAAGDRVLRRRGRQRPVRRPRPPLRRLPPTRQERLAYAGRPRPRRARHAQGRGSAAVHHGERPQARETGAPLRLGGEPGPPPGGGRVPPREGERPPRAEHEAAARPRALLGLVARLASPDESERRERARLLLSDLQGPSRPDPDED